MTNLRDEIIALYDKYKGTYPRLRIKAGFGDQYVNLGQYPHGESITGAAATLVEVLQKHETIPTPELPVPDEPSLPDMIVEVLDEVEPKPAKKKRATKPKVTMDDMLNVMRKFVTDFPDKRADLREYIHGDFGVKTTDEMKKGDYPKVIKWCEENKR